jgi:hypothetical protein
MVEYLSFTVFDQYGTRPHFIIAISRSPVSELSRMTGWKVWGAAL